MSGTESMKYDAVFLDVDGTLTWVDLDVEGYAEELSPYAPGGVTAEEAREPVWRSMKTHIRENIKYPDAGDLRDFKLRNAIATADTLGIVAPPHVLTDVSERRIIFTPYKESQAVLDELRAIGVPLYIVSNWDVLLEEVLEDLGWLGYFEGVVASAAVGSEKPDAGIFHEALRLSGTEPSRTIHVGNDSTADILGASGVGIHTFFVDRKGEGEVPGATYTAETLTPLPEILR